MWVSCCFRPSRDLLDLSITITIVRYVLRYCNLEIDMQTRRSLGTDGGSVTEASFFVDIRRRNELGRTCSYGAGGDAGRSVRSRMLLCYLFFVPEPIPDEARVRELFPSSSPMSTNTSGARSRAALPAGKRSSSVGPQTVMSRPSAAKSVASFSAAS